MDNFLSDYGPILIIIIVFFVRAILKTIVIHNKSKENNVSTLKYIKPYIFPIFICLSILVSVLISINICYFAIAIGIVIIVVDYFANKIISRGVN